MFKFVSLDNIIVIPTWLHGLLRIYFPRSVMVNNIAEEIIK